MANLDQIVNLIKSGKRRDARHLVADILKQNPENARAWAIMAELVDDPRQREECLRRADQLTDDPTIRRWVQAQLKSPTGDPDAVPQPRQTRATPERADTLLIALLGVLLITILVGAVLLVGLPRNSPQLAALLPFQPTRTAASSTSLPPALTVSATDAATPSMLPPSPTPTATSTAIPQPPTPTATLQLVAVQLPGLMPTTYQLPYPRSDAVTSRTLTGSVPGLDGTVNDVWYSSFGSTIAVDQDFLAVSDPDEGGIYIYTRTPASNGAIGWQYETVLTPDDLPDDASPRGFGGDLALSGNLLATTLFNQVYIYERQNGNWTLTAQISSPNPPETSRIQQIFGASVEFHEGLLYIGAPQWSPSNGADAPDEDLTGEVFIYEQSGTDWVVRQRIDAPTPDDYAFGASMKFDHDTLLVSTLKGRSFDQQNGSVRQHGNVHLFRREADQWTHLTTFEEPPDGTAHHFGAAMEVEGGRVIITSTPFLESSNHFYNGTGVVWIFDDTSSAGDWSSTRVDSISVPSDELFDKGNALGKAVLLENDLLIVTATDYVSPETGAGGVLVYQLNESGSWEQQTMLIPGFAPDIDFGRALVLDGERLIIGAPGATLVAGAVHLIDLPFLNPINRLQATDQPGHLDLSFGDQGYAELGAIEQDPTNLRLAPFSDDQFLVSFAYNSYRGSKELMLARIDPNGAYDPSFGNGSFNELYLNSFATVQEMVIQSDGKILIMEMGMGADREAGDINYESVLLRYESNGMLDPTFGEGGIIRAGFEGGGYHYSHLVLLPDGKIVVIGKNKMWDLEMLRFNPDGTLDTSFGRAGSVVLSQEDYFAHEMIYLPEGKLLILATIYGPMDDSTSFREDTPVLLRLKADGTLDTGFGSDGQIELASLGSLTDMVIQPDGSVVIVGYIEEKKAGFIRLTADGAVDPAFGTGGLAAIPFDAATVITSIALQPDRKIVGIGRFGGTSAVYRLTTDGLLDGEFNGGIWYGLYGEFIDLIILPDGDIMVGGAADKGSFGDEQQQFFLLRLIGQ